MLFMSKIPKNKWVKAKAVKLNNNGSISLKVDSMEEFARAVNKRYKKKRGSGMGPFYS
jgi:hypothetical protein